MVGSALYRVLQWLWLQCLCCNDSGRLTEGVMASSPLLVQELEKERDELNILVAEIHPNEVKQRRAKLRQKDVR